MALPIGNVMSPEDLSLFNSTKVAFVADPHQQLRIWHVNHIPKRGQSSPGKVTNDHVIGILGLGFPTALQIAGKKAEILRDYKLLKEWCLSRIRNIFIALAQRNKLLLDGRAVESSYKD
eukprot:scaffold73976_cov50-Attheya_sp.AAC.2